ncbi:methyltransferase-like protein 17 mitochondrial-like, partial [Trifolium medium]|nr:methyltransferase-like protein 17 mitochondrial-like [Trifolium medium]
MKRKVLGLFQTFNDIKNLTLPLPTTTSREIVEDTLKSWKINIPYSDICLAYRDEETNA